MKNNSNRISPAHFALVRAKLCYAFRQPEYQKGAAGGGNDLASTFTTAQCVTTIASYAFDKAGYPVRVALETQKTRSTPKVKSLVIWTGQSTVTVPMTVSPNLVRLRKSPLYLAHGEGVVSLVNSVLDEVLIAIDSERAVATDALGEEDFIAAE